MVSVSKIELCVQKTIFEERWKKDLWTRLTVKYLES